MRVNLPRPEVTLPPEGSGDRPNPRISRLDVWFPMTLLFVLTVVSVLGITSSSLGSWSPSGAPDQDSVLAGKPLPIRSDEWLAWSPMRIGNVQAGFPSERTFGMGTVEMGRQWRPHIPTRSIGQVVYSPFNLPMILLPHRQGFALSWWLPFAVAALALYAWLRLLGVEPVVALAAAMLVTTAPAAMWWSTWVVLPIAHGASACALLQWAVRLWPRRPRLAITVGLAAGWAAAGLPWTYQPFAIPVALFTGGVTLLWLMADPGRRRAAFRVGGVGGAFLIVATAAFYLHERDYYTALESTVYPGARRGYGGEVYFGRLFSSLFPFIMAGPQAHGLAIGNATEVSMGWTMAVPVAVGALLLACKFLWRDSERVVLYGTGALTLALASWPIVPWPPLLPQLTLMTFTPGGRVAPYVGYFGVVLLALVMGTGFRRRALAAAAGRYHLAALGLGIATAALAFRGADEFRSVYLSNLTTGQILIGVTAAGIFAASVMSRRSMAALLAATALSITSGAMVNPLQQGLGEIEDGPAAKLVRKLDRELVAPRDGRWAADSMLTDGLLNGQGVNSLSSFNDPVQPEGWQVVDPQKQYEREWNRFAYIVFDWAPSGQLNIKNPNPDVITVTIDPCDTRLSELRLTMVVSTQALSGSPCLRRVAQLQWQGQALTAYERTAQ